LLPASGFLRQTHLGSKLKFTELSVDKNNVVNSGETFRSNTYKFFGGIDNTKYLIMPKYSLRSVLGKRNIVPEFYLYENESRSWLEVSSDGRWNWAEFLEKFASDNKIKDLPQLEVVPDNSGLAQIGNVRTNMIESDSKKLEQILKLSLDPAAKNFMSGSDLRIFSEKFLGSFGVVFTEAELWHMGDSSFLILSNIENTLVLSLNSLRPTLIRLHYNGSDESKVLAHKFLKNWLSGSMWFFDYDKPFELDNSKLDFFSSLDYFPMTSGLAQSRALYEYWGGQFGALKKVIMASQDRVLQNLWLDSVQSMLSVERAKKTINPDWVQMMEDFMSGFPGAVK
jgi:hypothetical protein